MNPVDRILHAYRSADADHRLSLFLMYKDLRERFTAIERQENPVPANPTIPVKRSSPGNRMNGMSRSLLFVRATYWLGAVIDILAGIRMLLADRLVPRGVVPGLGFRYALWTAASLMVSWSALLVWADRNPVERRGVLLLTTCPALIGLMVSQAVAVETGFRTLTQAMSFWALEGVLVVLFLVSYSTARKLAMG